MGSTFARVQFHNSHDSHEIIGSHLYGTADMQMSELHVAAWMAICTVFERHVVAWTTICTVFTMVNTWGLVGLGWGADGNRLQSFDFYALQSESKKQKPRVTFFNCLLSWISELTQLLASVPWSPCAIKRTPKFVHLKWSLVS